MKALYCRKNRYLIALAVILLFLTPITKCVSQVSTQTFEETVETLDFKPLNKTTSTQYCCDKNNNTWLKITVPNDLLNKPLIFQFISAHIDKYSIYVKKNDTWIKVPGNTDLNGGKITPQFQENHFITSTPTIYFKSKTPYVHNGNYILVERSDFRAIVINNMMGLGIFYALFLVSVVTNFGLYFIFKEKVTLIYCLLISTIICIALLEDGFIYFLNDGSYDRMLVLTFLIPASCLLFSLFIYKFYEIETLSKKVKYYYITLISSFLALGIIYYYTQNILYFGILINGSIGTTLITIILGLIYCKHNLSVKIISYSFSILALAALGYYLSIYFGIHALSFIDMSVLRVILGVCFITTTYAILLKVKNLKTDHEYLRTELAHLKANQAKKIYDDLKQKEVTLILFSEQHEIIPTDTNNVLSDKKEEISYNDILRDKYCCTDREIDVILGIWDGLSNQEIAEKLSISLSTTKHHVSNAYIKLDVKSRSQALILKDQLT
ncbi:LuxR C-terminal-related transcriptional regulator [Myroides sp. N17-2]|uniref:LuxR C-terminal-related transcriptional regulator n=1 Tax=Myroides sp. N17-2 TaxID=2030799 RepID=UPI000EFA5813|nr:LuxR C-terminal-related transcriptional regulator [Myroides sp. N17-2]